MRKTAIETAAPEITNIDKAAIKVLKTPTSSPPDRKPEHQEKVFEEAAKVEELLTAHPQMYLFAPDSDMAQVLMGEIETPTLPPLTSGMDINTDTLPPSTEPRGAINDNSDQKECETNILRTAKSEKISPLDIEQQPATLPPLVAEIDNTPLPPGIIQGNTQETEVVDTIISDSSTVWSEQSDEHNKELMDGGDKKKKDLDGALNKDVSGLLNESDYSSSDTSVSDMKLQSSDKTPDLSKSQSTALEDREIVSKVIQYSGTYSCRHCSFDQSHNVTISTYVTRDEEIRRPRDLFVLHDYTGKCHSCENENSDNIKTSVFPDKENYKEEEDDEGRRPRAHLIHSEIDDQDKAWKSLNEDKLPSHIQADNTTPSQVLKPIPESVLDAPQAAKSLLPEELLAVENTQDQVPDTFHQTPDPLPAGEDPKKYKKEGHIELQCTLNEKSKKSPQSQLSPTPPTLREGDNGENELFDTNKEESLEKTPSQDSLEILDTFHETLGPPKSIPSQEIDFSLDVEKSKLLDTFIDTCATLPQDSLPSTYEGGSDSDPYPTHIMDNQAKMENQAKLENIAPKIEFQKN
ncbi:hypothetical protein JTB14_016978 [Gonioctena quinquepunctata]|nr:hypothetical protein JTB14_016978 [Gonioctena quinquepunctata]